jgi:hypothetical protein
MELDFDPDEIVTVDGPYISLRTAVLRYVAKKAAGQPLLPVMVHREAGKTPATLDAEHLEALSKLPEFQPD